MAYPRRDESFILATDASGWAIGAVLLYKLPNPTTLEEKESSPMAADV